MSNYNHHDIPVAYPPPQTTTATYVMAPPPIGYPTRDGHDQGGPAPSFPTTASKGEGFWKGCVAAICCCWVLDFCFGC